MPCPVVIPEDTILEIRTPLTASYLLVHDRDGQHGAHCAGRVSGDVLLPNCYRGVACFGIGGVAACGVGVCVGDALVIKLGRRMGDKR